jgi:hypothetical protein
MSDPSPDKIIDNANYEAAEKTFNFWRENILPEFDPSKGWSDIPADVRELWIELNEVQSNAFFDSIGDQLDEMK